MKILSRLLTLFIFLSLPLQLHAASPVDTCSLVTVEELTQILKAKVAPGVVVAAPRPHCTYEVQGKGMLKTVAIWAYHESAKAAFENGKTGLAPIKAVAGLGDEAYWGMNLMNILKGDIYMQIQLILPKGVDAFSISQQIAEQAVGRLK